MTIILRLQGLDLKANAEDIRTFFSRLHIPDGGVYIIGGILREAFIAFTREKDAELALRYTGKYLKSSKVTLHLSSLDELEHRLKSLLRKKNDFSHKQLTGKRPQQTSDQKSPSLKARPFDHNLGALPSSTAGTFDPRAANYPQPFYTDTANLQASPVQSVDCSVGVCTILQGLQSSQKRNEALPGTNDTVVPAAPPLTVNSEPGYVRLFGLPASATKDDICHFFKGLSVQEVIVNVKLGLGYGCLVKFASMQDARNALHYNQESLSSDCVEIRAGSEKMWTSALLECKNGNHREKERAPNSFKETTYHRQTSFYALRLKRQAVHRLKSKVEYIVMVRNLPKDMTKTHIKELFGCPKVAHKNVLHLLDERRNRTDTAFLIFNCTEEYDYALNLNGCHVESGTIKVSPITKEKMWHIMAKTRHRTVMDHQADIRRKTKSEKNVSSDN